jgi:hypothetical protein
MHKCRRNTGTEVVSVTPKRSRSPPIELEHLRAPVQQVVTTLRHAESAIRSHGRPDWPDRARAVEGAAGLGHLLP